jgi:hypothetical protein
VGASGRHARASRRPVAESPNIMSIIVSLRLFRQLKLHLLPVQHLNPHRRACSCTQKAPASISCQSSREQIGEERFSRGAMGPLGELWRYWQRPVCHHRKTTQQLWPRFELPLQRARHLGRVACTHDALAVPLQRNAIAVRVRLLDPRYLEHVLERHLPRQDGARQL